MRIIKVYACDQNTTDKGFVVLSSVDKIETALELDHKPMQGITFQIRRSSQAQLKHFLCENTSRVQILFDDAEAQLLLSPTSPPSTRSQPSTSNDNMLKHSPFRRSNETNITETSPSNDISKKTNRVVARGLPWTVTKWQVLEFFEGIKVLNGERGIRITHRDERGAMKAYVDVASANDHDAALKRKGRVFKGRTIDGNMQYLGPL